MIRTIVYLWMLWSCCFGVGAAQESDVVVPAVHANVRLHKKQLYTQDSKGRTISLTRKPAEFTLPEVTPQVEGHTQGLRLYFAAKGLRGGRITYGMFPYGLHRFPAAVLRFEVPIDSLGRAFLPVKKDLSGGYDLTGWTQKGFGVLGYRLTNALGRMIYEGKQAFSFENGRFAPRPTLLRGPFVAEVTSNSAVIWYETSQPVRTCVKTDASPDTFFSRSLFKRHELKMTGLLPDSQYRYTVGCDHLFVAFSFRTAPEKGSAAPFSFAYASDSRSGYGGGERDMCGANAWIMGRIGALALREKSSFVQFTGDLANGYCSDPDEWMLENTNWVHAVEPYWHYLPFYVGMGNHESMGWHSDSIGWIVADGFPYETHSAESAFARLFVHPENGPQSEDGSRYDPDAYKRGDFPTYAENVYHYRWGNTAMIVLNSDYWYAPILKKTKPLGGNLHGYIMDEQLRWLKNVLEEMEQDSTLAHIFVTVHTPPFPNGGHRGDCMWYDGDNSHRPIVAGTPVEKGIIERRDELLDLCANRSSKVIGFLCGDEHNYNRMLIQEETPRYPEGWTLPRLQLRRPLWQVINGAAGAPFYGQQQLPWSAAVQGFTVQNALCLFDIAGPTVSMRVINPETLEEIDRVKIR